jgi:hypothetical protein
VVCLGFGGDIGLNEVDLEVVEGGGNSGHEGESDADLHHGE